MHTPLLFEVIEWLTVSLVVLLSALYCLLTLAPNRLKSFIKQALLRCNLPRFLASKLEEAASSGGCGASCSGCSAKAAPSQTVRWHPRQP